MFTKKLEWDSDFFGYKIGQILIDKPVTPSDFQQIIEQSKAEGYNLIYCKSDQEQDFLFKLKNISSVKLADKKVTFSQPIKPQNEQTSFSEVQQYSATNLDKKLFDLALQSGIYSRFAIDPNFKNREFEKLYTEWIKNSVTGDLAKEVWTSTNESNTITGLLTLGIKNEAADIGLLAIDSNSRGLNLGKKLVETAKNRTQNWGLKKLQVVTQLDNNAACRFYEKCGFTIESTEYIYHIWL